MRNDGSGPVYSWKVYARIFLSLNEVGETKTYHAEDRKVFVSV